MFPYRNPGVLISIASVLNSTKEEVLGPFPSHRIVRGPFIILEVFSFGSCLFPAGQGQHLSR